MTRSRLATPLAPLLIAAALLAGLPARAAVYIGVFDPLYGTPFTNLGWKGTVTIDLPLAPGCLSNSISAACVPGSSLLNAEVVFYDVGSNVDLARIDWSANALGSASIFLVQDDGVTPTQLDTSTFGFQLPTPIGNFSNDAPYGGFLGIDFNLQFQINYAGVFSGPVLFWSSSNCRPNADCEGVNDYVNYGPNLRFRRVPEQQVPEPGTLVLLASGLLIALGVTRRATQVQTRARSD